MPDLDDLDAEFMAELRAQTVEQRRELADRAHADFMGALNAGISRPTMGDADERIEWTYNQPLPMRYALTPVAPYRFNPPAPYALPATPREPLPLPAPPPTLPRAMVVVRLPLRMRWWHRLRLWFFGWAG